MTTTHTTMSPETYYLGSGPMIDAPSIVEYCRSGFRSATTKKERQCFVAVLSSWAVPAHVALALASGAVDYFIETREGGLRTVVVTA
jgi:hypothetical protein